MGEAACGLAATGHFLPLGRQFTAARKSRPRWFRSCTAEPVLQSLLTTRSPFWIGRLFSPKALPTDLLGVVFMTSMRPT